jgi:ABC-type polysaccharide/polyol phosphate transport system ATPase subunit
MLRAWVRHEPLKKEFWLLHNLSFKVKSGEKLALIGKNGAGKTTLLRILAGIYDKTGGDVAIKKTPNAFFSFWTGFNNNLSVIDNVYLFGAVHGMNRNFLKERIHRIFEMTELYDLRFSPLKELSMGQGQRLALSVFLQAPGDFLIFDESLEFVDRGFAQKCGAYFRDLFSSDKTIIMTSHDNSFLKKYCGTAIWLDGGIIRMYGNIKEVISEYERSLIIETPALINEGEAKF